MGIQQDAARDQEEKAIREELTLRAIELSRTMRHAAKMGLRVDIDVLEVQEDDDPLPVRIVQVRAEKP